MVIQIFESHTKLDENTCNRFDIATAREGIKVFRSEYESIEPPAWETIKNKISESVALFLLIGPELIKAQETASYDWKFTQNWIAYEVGVACALDIDVWVVCDDVTINFPVPYLNNYCTGKIQIRHDGFERQVLHNYINGYTYPYPRVLERAISCSHSECNAQFNYHVKEEKGASIVCPTCLRKIRFPKGHLI